VREVREVRLRAAAHDDSILFCPPSGRLTGELRHRRLARHPPTAAIIITGDHNGAVADDDCIGTHLQKDKGQRVTAHHPSRVLLRSITWPPRDRTTVPPAWSLGLQMLITGLCSGPRSLNQQLTYGIAGPCRTACFADRAPHSGHEPELVFFDRRDGQVGNSLAKSHPWSAARRSERPCPVQRSTCSAAAT
jgi:hypothetical protein